MRMRVRVRVFMYYMYVLCMGGYYSNTYYENPKLYLMNDFVCNI